MRRLAPLLLLCAGCLEFDPAALGIVCDEQRQVCNPRAPGGGLYALTVADLVQGKIELDASSTDQVLVVTVTRNGVPAEGINVAISHNAPAGSEPSFPEGAATTTYADGKAYLYLRATLVGSYELSFKAADDPPQPFPTVVRPGAPRSFDADQVAPLVGRVGETVTFTSALVRDEFGNLAVGRSIYFQPIPTVQGAGADYLYPQSATVDTDGKARTTFTRNKTAGDWTALAKLNYDDLPSATTNRSYQAVNTPGPAAQARFNGAPCLNVSRGSNHTFTLQLTDEWDNPVTQEFVAISVTAPTLASPGTVACSFATGTLNTSTDGTVSGSCQVGASATAFEVTATVASGRTTRQLLGILDNIPPPGGPPTNLSLLTAGAYAAGVGQAFMNGDNFLQLSASVAATGGIADLAVEFAADVPTANNPASLSFDYAYPRRTACALTDASGVATLGYSDIPYANPFPGTYQAQVGVPGSALTAQLISFSNTP